MSVKGSLIASVGVLLLVTTVNAGGWAVRTVLDMPDHAVAGKPLLLTFMVRQHGVSPMADLTPTITAKSAADTVKTMAVAAKRTGEYAARLVFPRPGTWTIEIDAYGTSTLPALTVIAPGTPAPPPLSPAALGERLFVAKGCIGCHVNHDVRGGENLIEAGPGLTGKRFSGTYIRNLLTNPQAVFARARPETGDTDGWEMPNLELKEKEIAALGAFLSRR
jgi:hypothetical protein